MYYIVVHDVIQLVKEVIVETLIIEEDRPAHIAKHNIIIDEVLEVLTGDYVYRISDSFQKNGPSICPCLKLPF
jgi:hypothetical protein